MYVVQKMSNSQSTAPRGCYFSQMESDHHVATRVYVYVQTSSMPACLCMSVCYSTKTPEHRVVSCLVVLAGFQLSSPWDCWSHRQAYTEMSQELATGRQPGGFSEISCGKSYTKIWILKGGYRGRGGYPPPVPPVLRSRFLYRIFHKKFPRIRPVAFQCPV